MLVKWWIHLCALLPLTVFSDHLKRLYDKSGCLTDSSRLEVQLHWRLCRWSWCVSDWREAYECQPSAVFLGEHRWWGSSRQPGSWQHVQTTSGGQGQKPMLLAENLRDVVTSQSACHQPSVMLQYDFKIFCSWQHWLAFLTLCMSYQQLQLFKISVLWQLLNVSRKWYWVYQSIVF